MIRPFKKRISRVDPWFLLFLIVYFVALLWASALQPLWLDELLDLIQIRDLPFTELVRAVPQNAGGVPLSYIVRFGSVHAFGFSNLAARLPSLLASVGAIWGILAIARSQRLWRPELLTATFALTPIQLRYAIESRPYSLELCLAAWCTYVLLQLRCKTSLGLWSVYTVLLIALFYTQPYGVFVAVGQVLYLCFTSRSFRVRVAAPIALIAAGACFLPWAVQAARTWHASADAQQVNRISLRSTLMIVKELSGAGYAGGIAMLGLASLGGFFAQSKREVTKEQFDADGERTPAGFWLSSAIAALVLPLVLDSLFNYFLAVRQMLPVLIPLAVLMGFAFRKLRMLRWQRADLMSGVSLLCVFGVADGLQFIKPREDWQAAAKQLKVESDEGACILFAPASSDQLYSFFVPQLSGRKCGTSLSASDVILAKSPYRSETSFETERDRLLVSGYRRIELSVQADKEGPGPALYLYKRQPKTSK